LYSQGIINLHVVLYECETCSLNTSGEHRLWVFENRILLKIFGPEGDKVTGGWRRMHYEEFCNLHSSGDRPGI
jgi:hypothetical protein